MIEKLHACDQLSPDADEEMVKIIAQRQYRRLMDEIAPKMVPGTWYATKLEQQFFLKPGQGAVLQSAVTVKECPVEQTVYIPPEDMYLKGGTELPLIQKIKRCIAYLLDKSGGKYERKEKR